MVLHIHDNLFISDLQEHFNNCFPYLKMEFYKRHPHPGRKNMERDLIQPYNRIGEIRNNDKEGELVIKSWDNIAKVKRELEAFGLIVEIFRNENGEWVQSPKPNKLTLAQHIEIARRADKKTGVEVKEELEEFNEF